MRTRVVQTCLIAVAACGAARAQGPAPAPYWPGVEWRTATPESQGLDSQALASAIDQVRQQRWGTHSLLVIRHGFVVATADFYPYRSTAPHDVASVTKTITSTLTGVAVANRLLTLDQKVLSFFPAESPADPDAGKRAITVENLLRMESGLDCGFLPGEPELERMKRSANWVQFALSLPMKYDRGTRPSYCSPGYHVLGSVIGAAARTSELEFGRRYLFDPLNMKDVVLHAGTALPTRSDGGGHGRRGIRADEERNDRRHANAVAASRPRLWPRPPLIEPLSGHPSLTLSPISWQFSLARTGRWPKRRPASAPR